MFFTYVDDDGNEEEVNLPTRYEVCSRCNGEGHHTNPSIDGNGITASEWAEWDDEDKENYMSGVYNVACYECSGKRVVKVVDESRLDNKLKAAYKKYVEDERLYEREFQFENAYYYY